MPRARRTREIKAYTELEYFPVHNQLIYIGTRMHWARIFSRGFLITRFGQDLDRWIRDARQSCILLLAQHRSVYPGSETSLSRNDERSSNGVKDSDNER